jgi:hypothetical protein
MRDRKVEPVVALAQLADVGVALGIVDELMVRSACTSSAPCRFGLSRAAAASPLLAEVSTAAPIAAMRSLPGF